MSAFPLPAELPRLPLAPARTLGMVGGGRVGDGRVGAGRVGAGVDEPVAAFPARWLADLPAPPSIGVHVPGVEGVVRFALGGDGAADEQGAVFGVEEWRALVAGVEADRVWPADLRGFCARKRAEPAWRLEAGEALAGVRPDPSERWSLRRVLARLGAELVSLG